VPTQYVRIQGGKTPLTSLSHLITPHILFLSSEQTTFASSAIINIDGGAI